MSDANFSTNWKSYVDIKLIEPKYLLLGIVVLISLSLFGDQSFHKQRMEGCHDGGCLSVEIHYELNNLGFEGSEGQISHSERNTYVSFGFNETNEFMEIYSKMMMGLLVSALFLTYKMNQLVRGREEASYVKNISYFVSLLALLSLLYLVIFLPNSISDDLTAKEYPIDGLPINSVSDVSFFGGKMMVVEFPSEFESRPGYGFWFSFLGCILCLLLSWRSFYEANATTTIVKDSAISKSSIGASGKSKAEEIKEIKELLDSGAIDKDDYEKMKREIIG